MDEEDLKSDESIILKWWKQRTELEKKLMISITVAVLLVFGMMLFSMIKPKVVPSEPCSTSGCLLAASQIIRDVDSTIDPCDDFLKFVCGKLIENTHGDLEAAPRTQFQKHIRGHLLDILKEPVNNDATYIFKSQKELFDGCLNETKGEESLEMFKAFLNESNGWPMAIGFGWKDKLFDWTDMTIKLRRRGFYYSMLLDFNIIQDPKDLTKFIIQINEPYVKSVEHKHKELYKKYMIDVAMVFGAKQDRAEEDAEMVLNFMDELNKISFKNRTNPFAEEELRRIAVKDFQYHNYEIDWLTFINDIIYPNKKITKLDYVIFPRPEFMDEFTQLMNVVPERVPANYMIWSVLEDIIPLLSKELRELQDNYNSITKSNLLMDNRDDYCASLVMERFSPLPAVIEYARKYLPSENRDQVQELVGNIKNAFKNHLLEIEWISDESKEKASEKVDKIIDIIGAQGDYYDDAIFEEYDTNKYFEKIQGSPFFYMYLNSTRTSVDTFFSLIDTPKNITPVEQLYIEIILLFPETLYSFVADTLMLPVAVIQGSFHSDQPMFLNYGALGSAIGNQLTAGFLTEGSNYIPRSSKNVIWDKQTEKAYLEKEKCFNQDLGRYKKGKYAESVHDSSIIAKITGTKISYTAYKNWIAENGEENDLIGIDYAPKQLFWLSAMSYQCSLFAEHDLKEIIEDYNSKFLEVSAFIRNNDDFGNDFGCPADSPMNPSEKCQL